MILDYEYFKNVQSELNPLYFCNILPLCGKYQSSSKLMYIIINKHKTKECYKVDIFVVASTNYQ